MELIEGLRDFTQDGKHTRFFDCIIKCDDKLYKCHRNRLCQIEYFDRCFDDQFKIEEIDGKPMINFDVKYTSVMNLLINAIYGNKISYESINDNDLENLKHLTDYVCYLDLNYDLLDISLMKLIALNSINNIMEATDKASQYLHNIDSQTLIDYFNQQYNGLYHHKLTSYQYLILCVIFHRKLQHQLYKHIRTEKIADDDIKQLVKLDRYNSVAYYLNSLKMKKKFDIANKIMGEEDFDYEEVNDQLGDIVLTFLSDYKYDYKV